MLLLLYHLFKLLMTEITFAHSRCALHRRFAIVNMMRNQLPLKKISRKSILFRLNLS